MRILYFSLVESRLSYGILGWGGVVKSHLNKLEIVQKYFLKIMYGKERTYPSDTLFSDTKIFDLRQLYFLKTLTHLFKNKNSLCLIDHQYSTRSRAGNLAQTLSSEKTIGQRHYSFIAPRLYNTLPREIQTINSIQYFKSKIKKYLYSIDRHTINRMIDIKNN